jgi:hypothetical protein
VIGIIPGIAIEPIIPPPPIQRVISSIAIQDVRLGAAVDDIGEGVPSETERVCGVLHQLALRQGRVAKRVGLAQVDPTVLDHDLIRHIGIGPIGQDEILRWVRADHTCAYMQILWANPICETEHR